MKILHILTDSNIGGAGIYLYYLLREMDYNVFDIHVVCPENAKIAEKLKTTKAKIIELEDLAPDKSLDVPSIFSLLKLIKRIKPDIVHTHASLSGRLAALLSKALGVHTRIIFTKHCMDKPLEPGSLKLRANRFVNNLTCDRVIAVSEAVRASMIAAGTPAGLIQTIHNAIDLNLYKGPFELDKIRVKYNLENARVVGITGRLEHVKGHEYFLEAASRLKDIPDLKFLIVGAGTREKELKEMAAKLDISDKVVFTGHIDNVAEVMNVFDIAVLTSVSEAIGLALLEAMALGKPCVASGTGGIPEIIKEGVNGLLFTPGDVEKLVSHIRYLLENDEIRNRMGEQGRKMVLESYSASNMAHKVMEMYLAV